jgi:fused signal recognition particle receptor
VSEDDGKKKKGGFLKRAFGLKSKEDKLAEAAALKAEQAAEVDRQMAGRMAAINAAALKSAREQDEAESGKPDDAAENARIEAEERKAAEAQALKDVEAAKKLAEEKRLAAEKAKADAEAQAVAAAEKASAAEAKRLADEQADKERIAKEQEQARLAEEKRKADQKAADLAEKERIRAEKLAAAEAEKQRKLAEKEAAKQKAAEEKERVQAEKAALALAKKQQGEAEAAALKAKQEQERISREAAEKLEAEKREANRLAAEAAEAERLEIERLAAEKAEADRIEAERITAEQAEAERTTAEARAAEAKETEKLAAEKQAAAEAEVAKIAIEKAEAERLDAEQLEAEAQETARLEAEKAALAEQEAQKAEAEAPAPAPVDPNAPVRKGFLSRITDGLKKSTNRMSDSVSTLFNKRKLDAEALEELEDLLIASDLGTGPAMRVTEMLAKDKFDKQVTGMEIKIALADVIAATLKPLEKKLELGNGNPEIVLFVGVNGSGKTTTLGKIAKRYTDQGKKVLIAAGDTFRAAAVEQLKVWGERANAPVISAPLGSDAAGLVYDAITKAKAEKFDILMIDTAGRLQNRTELMEELSKVVRVIKKQDETAPHHSILVLDATVGQNALSQTEAFLATAGITGLIMTKLDGTAKGGVLVALADKFKLPIHSIGIGERIEDLENFSADVFAAALSGVADAVIDEA